MGQACLLAMMLRKPRAADSLLCHRGATFPRDPRHLHTSASNNQAMEADALDPKSRKIFSKPAMQHPTPASYAVCQRPRCTHHTQPCVMAKHLSGAGTRSFPRVSFYVSTVAPITGCQYSIQSQRSSQQSSPPGRWHQRAILSVEGP